MLQSRITFDLLFKRGITPVCLGNKNQNFFTELVNMRPYTDGFDTIYKQFYSFVKVGDKNSQTFEIGFNSFVFTSSKIYRINADLSVTLMLDYIPVGGKWSCADYQIYALFTNGVATVEYINGVFSLTTIIPQAKVICNFNGQLILGGFKASDFNAFVPGTITNDAEGQAFIAWSGIGNLNCVPSESNVTAGFRSLNEAGAILGISKQHSANQDYVMVACERGCVELPTYEHTFGRNPRSEFGPRSEEEYCAGEAFSFFISRTGMLYRLSHDFTTMVRRIKAEPLGYEELFRDVETRIFYQKSTEELFISVASLGITYVYSNLGMYSISGLITGVSDKESSWRFTTPSIPDLSNASFVTSVLDFKDPGIKILEEVSIGLDTLEVEQDVSICIFSRERVNGPWVQSPYLQLNEFNCVKPHIAGSEFKIGYLHRNFSFSSLDWLSVQYVKIDKRFNRGHVFVDQNKED